MEVLDEDAEPVHRGDADCVACADVLMRFGEVFAAVAAAPADLSAKTRSASPMASSLAGEVLIVVADARLPTVLMCCVVSRAPVGSVAVLRNGPYCDAQTQAWHMLRTGIPQSERVTHARRVDGGGATESRDLGHFVGVVRSPRHTSRVQQSRQCSNCCSS